jgi:hypothetical protein
MLMVLKNSKIEGNNLLELTFIEDAEAKTKIENLEGRSLKLFQYANDSAIIMIAKCLEKRLVPRHDDKRYACQIWEMLKPTRSVIIAFQAARDIEQLRCQDFDSNLLYYEEMVSLYDQLVLEQGTQCYD